MVGAEFFLGLGQVKTFENGWSFRAKAAETVRRIGKGVSRHEAIHAVIGVVRGRRVRRVTRIAGPGYDGLTELDAYDRAAFMGPEVANEDGTGYDVGVADINHDRHSGAAEAAPIISTHQEEIDAVAEGIENYGTLNHEGVVSYMHKGARRRLGVVPVTVEMIKPNGKVEARPLEVVEASVKVSHDLFPGEWVELSKAV